jgi:lipopolysaccharide biosynthesis regulator YciM|tara:strand:- start:162 stop:386 length:225 start_codon:yes stop_codon:yes gene_type:complete
VIDQLTKVLVGLYEEQEKPQNVIEFIKKSLGEPTDTDVEQLLAENESMKREKNELQKKIDDLTRELENERSGNQ